MRKGSIITTSDCILFVLIKSKRGVTAIYFLLFFSMSTGTVKRLFVGKRSSSCEAEGLPTVERLEVRMLT